MVEALEAVAASVEALPGANIGSVAVSAETMPGGNYETLDLYTSGAEAMYCTWCIAHQHETRRILDRGKDLGIGPGIGRKIPGTGGLTERFRYDDHKPLGPHINYETIIPGIDRKPIIDNFHITGIPKKPKY